MGFFDKVTEGIGTVAKKSEEMLQVSKLRSQLSDLNKNKTQKLAEIGKKAMELSDGGSIADESIQKMSSEVKDIDSQIEKVEKEIEEVQSAK